MLMTRDRRPAIQTLRGWAISVLLETGAIRECEEHGWMRDRASAPSTWPAGSRRKERPQRRRSLGSPRFSMASVTAAPTAPRTPPDSLD
jgi:hypothetical protein